MSIKLLYTNDGECFDYLRSQFPLYQNKEEIWTDLTRLYDNLRPSYSSCRHLEFGGILVGLDEINRLISLQAFEIASICPSEKILIVWSMYSAALYVQNLAQELRSLGFICELIGIKTSWIGELNVRITDSPSYCAENCFVICADFMLGTGCTFNCLHNYLLDNGTEPTINVALVSLLQENRIYSPPLLEPFIELAENPWIIGFNADCLSEGLQAGRKLPFLAYLVPEGAGLRNKLLESRLNSA